MNLAVIANSIPDDYYFIIAVVSIFLLFAILFVVRTLLRNHNYRKQARDLEKKYEEAFSILVGQDSQYIKRLEIIAQSNLLYVEIHHNFLIRYEEIKNTSSHNAKMAIDVLQELINSKHFRGIKDTFRTNKEVVLVYEEQVSLFTKELKDVLNVEEQCRINALQQKEKLRKLKNIYFEHESELKLVEKSFETLFNNIDEAFTQFEDCIDRATYDEVESILTRVNDVLNELDLIIGDMPVICAFVDDVAPSKLKRLREDFNRMSNNNYPVHHLRVINSLEEMGLEIEDIRKRVLMLSLEGCRDQLENLFDRIENMHRAFEDEKVAKTVFEDQCDGIYSNVNRIEKDFIKLCNLIPDVKKMYIIEPEFEGKIEAIRKEISTLTLIKRTLDNFIHSNTRQPYSLLVEKMVALESEAEKINKEMKIFSDHLISLENDCEYASNYMHETYFNLKNIEKNIRDMDCEAFELKVQNSFEQCYEFLDKIESSLATSPANVSEINAYISGLTIIYTELSKQVEENVNFSIAAENLIVFANRSRHRLGDVKAVFNQIETSFFEGEFERVYLEAGNAVKKIQGKF